jgi:hypothetical protein
MNDSPKISSKEILASKSYKGWKRSKKLKLALTASIGTASLAGGLVGGFA